MIHNTQQQQMVKMPPPLHLFEDEISPFARSFFFFSKILKTLLVIVPNSPFSVMFQVLQTYCVITVEHFLKKYPQKEVRWGEVW